MLVLYVPPTIGLVNFVFVKTETLPLSLSRFKILLHKRMKVTLILSATFLAVSYTHLDVYKRQVQIYIIYLNICVKYNII